MSWVDPAGVKQFDGTVQKIRTDGTHVLSSELDEDAGEILRREWVPPPLEPATDVVATAIGENRIHVTWKNPPRMAGVTAIFILSEPDKFAVSFDGTQTTSHTFMVNQGNTTEYQFKVVVHQPVGDVWVESELSNAVAAVP